MGPTKIIATNFDRQNNHNRRLPEELQGDPKDNLEFTIRERCLASEALNPSNLEDFDKAVSFA